MKRHIFGGICQVLFRKKWGDFNYEQRKSLEKSRLRIPRRYYDKGGVESIDTLGGRQKMTIINESGLYALVFGSRLKIAKEFKHWVTSEVLPSIRKNGAYIRNQENMTPAEIVARGLIAAQKIIEERLDHSTQPLFILTYSH